MAQRLKEKTLKEISREALLACECPGDNEDEEILVPVDYTTLEKHFGFDEETALVDEDGRMDAG